MEILEVVMADLYEMDQLSYYDSGLYHVKSRNLLNPFAIIPTI